MQLLWKKTNWRNVESVTITCHGGAMMGFAGATWPWLGAALAKTSEIEVRTSVRAPILRYHPAIVAQVFATFGYMFPDRVF
jgi:alkanesulfonate monooxygenase SsuD/methylene tetrahydromethanopterin reductase-like flavin-dependent oxidoreductase (luciferase family)